MTTISAQRADTQVAIRTRSPSRPQVTTRHTGYSQDTARTWLGRAAAMLLLLTGCSANRQLEPGHPEEPNVAILGTRGTLIPSVDTTSLLQLLSQVPAAQWKTVLDLYSADPTVSAAKWVEFGGSPQLQGLARSAWGPVAVVGDRNRMRSRAADRAHVWNEPVVIHLVPSGSRLEIKVRSQGSRPAGLDRVLLPADMATPEQLSSALSELARVRNNLERHGGFDSRGRPVVLRHDKPEPLPATWRGYLESILARLHVAPVSDLPEVGRVPTLRIARIGQVDPATREP